MQKKYLLITFAIGFALTATMFFTSAASNTQQATSQDSLAIDNVSQHKLTYILESPGGDSITLGTSEPGKQVVLTNALSNIGTIGKLASNELTIHAKDEKGNEFFTLLIDKDEIMQRNGFIQIPGSGGRRAQKELSSKPTVAPLPTPSQ